MDHFTQMSRPRILATLLSLPFLAFGLHASSQSWSENSNLSTKHLESISSSFFSSQFTDNVEIITDNDRSFESKLDIIENAQSELRLAYYIYTSDYSSSYLSQKILEAAERGVRVKILVDYITNYQHLDFFRMLEVESRKYRGDIKVRFFGRPSRNFVLDSVYLTTSCGEAFYQSEDKELCQNVKFNEVDRAFKDDESSQKLNISNFSTEASGQFLSGLYSKNADLALGALVQGQGIDLERLQKGGSSTDPEDIDALKEFAKLLYVSRTGSFMERAIAKVKLFIAYRVYGEQLNPLYNMLTGTLPLNVDPSTAYRATRDRRGKDLVHLTDFIHHKLIMADARSPYLNARKHQILMGGRNIEDAYHMQPNELSDKYTFIDTDIRIDLSSTSQAMNNSFDRLWNFRSLVASIDEIDKHAPNALASTQAIFKSVCEKAHRDELTGLVDDSQVPSCIERFTEKRGALETKDRIAYYRTLMNNNADAFKANYTPAPQDPSFVAEKGERFRAYYLENLHFLKEDSSQKRIYGATSGEETKSAKYIHDAWVRGLKMTCDKAVQTLSPQEAIIHNAYVAFPSNLLQALANMVDGTWSCPQVTVKVMTNSPDTTDLKVVNSLGIFGIKALLDYMSSSQSSEACQSGSCADFKYYEYEKVQADRGSDERSLHAKVNIFGSDTIMVGSANADPRSFMMDTNNGVLIEGSPSLVRSYSEWLEGKIQNGQIVEKTDLIKNIEVEHILAATRSEMSSELARYGVNNRLSETQAEQLLDYAMKIYEGAYELSLVIVDNTLFNAQKTQIVDAIRRESRGSAISINVFRRAQQREIQRLERVRQNAREKFDSYFQLL